MQLIETNEIDFYYISNKPDLEELLKLLKKQELLFCDTETYPLYNIYGAAASWQDPWTSRVRLWQVNYPGSRTPYIVDLLKIGVENCDSLKEVLTSKSIRKIYHNVKYDQKMLKSTLDVWQENAWCTLVCAQRINVCTGFRAGQMRGNSLRALARDYLGIDLSKTEQTSDWSNPELTISQLTYAALDVGSPKESGLDSILGYLYNLFINLLYSPAPRGFGGHCKLKGFKEPIEVDQAANLRLAKIEYNGMPVSTKMLELIYNSAQEEIEKLIVELAFTLGLQVIPQIEYTEAGPIARYQISEKTRKKFNSSTELVKLINQFFKKQDIKLTDAQSSSFEEAIKELKKIESSRNQKDDESVDDEENQEEEDEYELEQEEISTGIELLDKLIKYKELSKLVSIDYRKLINPVTGRLHSSYQCIGASTGRMSSGGKGFYNCQNISTKSIVIKYLLSQNPYTKNLKFDKDIEVAEKVTMRNAFVADRLGIILASADFSAQELRVAAALSRDPNMAKVYKLESEYKKKIREKPKHPVTGKPYSDPRIDLHIMAGTSLSAEVKRLVEEEPWNATADNPVVKPIRKKAKPLSYGLIYLAGPGTIAIQIDSTVDEAKVTIDKYFSYPGGFYGLNEWLQSTATVGTELRWIQLATGEIVMINESNSKGISDGNSSSRRSCNTSIQGLSATQSKLALIKADQKFQELDKKYELLLNGRQAELIAIVHDEIDALIPGECHFNLVPDEELNKKYKTDCYYTPETDEEKLFDKQLAEHLMAIEYSNALKDSMEEAMQETFSLIGSEIPALSSVASNLYWKH